MRSPFRNFTIPLPLIITVFIDLLGLGIMVPLFAPLLLSPDSGLFAVSAGFATRSIVLGFLFGTYPIFQFLGSPYLGSLSDKYGRKPVITASLVGTMIGCATTAIGIMTGDIYLLFLGRAIDGFTGGKVLVVYSAIADISPYRERGKNFGIIALAFGLGFLVGPVIGGIISNPAIVSWFNFATPFWLSGILATINILAVQYFLKETIKSKRDFSLSWKLPFTNVVKAFGKRNLTVIIMIVFLMDFGLNFFIQFYQVSLIQKYGFNQTDVGYLFGYIGIWMAFTQGFINSKLSRYMEPHKILNYSILLLAFVFPFLIIQTDYRMLYLIIPLAAVFQGLCHPNTTAVISNEAEENYQGEIMGISMSITSIAYAVPPILSGFLVSLHINLPTMLASALTFISWLLFVTLYKPATRTKHEETPYISI